MNVIPAANHEEATTITQEFISNLDNLPNEVQHLLAEIRHRDIRSQEIQQDIQKETTRYIRHALKSTARENSLGVSSGSGKENNGNSGSNSRSDSSASGQKDGKEKDREMKEREKDAQIPGRVAVDYSELEELAQEKIALSKRLVNVLTKVNARLENDLNRVIQLSGEGAVEPQQHVEVKGGYVVNVTPVMANIGSTVGNSIGGVGSGSGSVLLGTGSGGAVGSGSIGIGSNNTVGILQQSQQQQVVGNVASSTGLGAGGRSNTMEKMMEGLRQAAGVGGGKGVNDMSGAPGVVLTGLGAGATSYKRRRLNVSGSVVAGSGAGLQQQGRSRQQQQQRGNGHGHGRGRRGGSIDEGEEEDAEGEEDDEMEEGGDQEDKTLYCYCHRVSYGEMIGCDNEECEYQWFHLECIGLKPPLPERWYCDACIKKMGGSGSSNIDRGGRKGRRK